MEDTCDAHVSGIDHFASDHFASDWTDSQHNLGNLCERLSGHEHGVRDIWLSSILGCKSLEQQHLTEVASPSTRS